MSEQNDASRSPRAFKRKSGGGSFCCVPGCTNESGKDKRSGTERKYFRFPKPKTQQLKLWLIAIKRENFEARNWHRICSDHFRGGKKGKFPNDPGYVPAIFPFQKQPTPRQTNNSSAPVKSPLKSINVFKNKQPKQKIRRQLKFDTTSSSQEKKKEKLITPQINLHDYIVTETENCESIIKYLPEIKQKMQELDNARQEIEILKNQVLDLTQMQKNPKQIQFWTGFPNYETMFAVFEFLEPRARHMIYRRGNSGMSSTESSSFPGMKTFYNKRGPNRKLSLLEEFFLTMVRLKVGLLVEDLAQRFNVSTGTVSSIFTSWIHLMYSDLKLICELPPRRVTSKNQSSAIGSYSDVQVILDCTELFVQNPSKLNARKQMFSNYKHHITCKFLVGISPQMGITYVSKMYGGRASDKFITSDCSDLLENLESGKGSVMADRGFVVQGLFSDMGVELHMPAFKGAERPQLSAKEGAASESISSVRIHIERAIQRIKTYHILDGELKLSMKDIAEQIFTVCAYLVNFQSPIVKSNCER